MGFDTLFRELNELTAQEKAIRENSDLTQAEASELLAAWERAKYDWKAPAFKGLSESWQDLKDRYAALTATDPKAMTPVELRAARSELYWLSEEAAIGVRTQYAILELYHPNPELKEELRKRVLTLVYAGILDQRLKVLRANGQSEPENV